MPSVRMVEVVTASGYSSRTRAANASGSGTASILLNTTRIGRSARSSSASTRSTTRICPSQSGWLASTTCSSRSAAARLLQRRAEAGHQVVRQLADETDGVGHPGALALAELDFARQGVERGEQPVLDHDLVLARERPQNARLAGVGVADERDAQHRIAAGPQILAVPLDALELRLEPLDALPDDPAVGLELGLARAPEADAAADAREVGPHPREPGQQVLRAAPARPGAWPRGCARGWRRCRG